VKSSTMKYELQRTAEYFGTWSLNYIEYGSPSDDINLGFLECDGYMYSLFWFDPPIPATSYWSGSSWFILSYDFVQWILRDRDVVPFWKNIMKRAAFSDETFFQTIIQYSPFKSGLIPENHRFVTWETSFQKCYHDVLGDLCGRHPELLVRDQISSLFVNPQKFFVRKVKGVDIVHEIERRRNLPQFMGIKKKIIIGNETLGLDLSIGSSPVEFEWTIGPCSSPMVKCEDFGKEETCVVRAGDKCLETKHDRTNQEVFLNDCHYGVTQHFRFSNCSVQKKSVNLPPLCVGRNLRLWSCIGIDQLRLVD
jgi:hypothetical protein